MRVLPLILAKVVLPLIVQMKVGVVVVAKVRVAAKFRVELATTVLALVISTPWELSESLPPPPH